MLQKQLSSKDEWVMSVALGIGIGFGLYTFITLTELLIKFTR